MQQTSEIAEIRAFVALADTGSFVAAGRMLDRDATVLSRRLNLLEKRLGVRLTERTTRKVMLTEAGEVYLARVRDLLHGLDAARQEAAAFGSGEPSGRLRVALPGSFARLWMAPVVTGFLRAHPQVTLAASYSNEFVDIVGQGYDLAVRLADLPDSRLVARKVGSRRRLICASPDYLARHAGPIRPEEVAEHDCLCFTGRDDPFRWAFRTSDGGRRSISVRCRIASDDADLLVEAAMAGLGLFYTTDWHVGPLLGSGRLVEVLQEWPVDDAGAIYILIPKSVRLPSKTRAFSDWIARGLSSSPWNRTPWPARPSGGEDHPVAGRTD